MNNTKKTILFAIALMLAGAICCDCGIDITGTTLLVVGVALAIFAPMLEFEP